MNTENFDLRTLTTLGKQRPIIYNYKDKQHGNQDIPEKLWTEILFGFSLFLISNNKDNKIRTITSSSSKDNVSKFNN